MPDMLWRDAAKNASSLVVKVGTSALTDDNGSLDEKFLSQLASQVSSAMKSGRQVTLVSSGAVGAGMGELDMKKRPKTLPVLQAAAAVGQGQLMQKFHRVFARRNIKVAQILVTRGDFESRTRYLNIRNTINALHELSVVPIINENDTVAVDELRFGDNDVIAAHITNMISAELLVLLTVVDGVMDKGKVLDCIVDADDASSTIATKTKSSLGSGGMTAKLQAASLVNSAGEPVIIANARTKNIIGKILSGSRIGTLCVPSEKKMSSRRRWIGQASRAAGRITVDSGAADALAKRGRSLLPSGITAVSGNFLTGDSVIIESADGAEIARGLSNYDSDQVMQIMGLKSSQIQKKLGQKPYDEVVHRDNMVII